MNARALYSAVLMAGLLVACGGNAPEDHPDTGASEPDAGTPVDAMAGEPEAPEMLSCSAGTTLTPGDQEMKLTHDGVERSFLLHVPASYAGDQLVPLVLDIHGLGGTAAYQKSTSGWLAKSDEKGFLVVHPQGLTNSWNGGGCCGDSFAKQVDDEGFLRAIVDKLKQEGCVNPKRVYATGLSNGGAVAHLLACRAADVFAATAPISMSNRTDPCEPGRGISVTMFRATGDELVPYESTAKAIGALEDFERWKVRNECQGEPETTHGVCKTYKQCKDGAEVTLCTITTTAEDTPWGGHLLYWQAIRENVPVPDVVWPVFERHKL